jgi:hypothetical protein
MFFESFIEQGSSPWGAWEPFLAVSIDIQGLPTPVLSGSGMKVARLKRAFQPVTPAPLPLKNGKSLKALEEGLKQGLKQGL